MWSRREGRTAQSLRVGAPGCWLRLHWTLAWLEDLSEFLCLPLVPHPWGEDKLYLFQRAVWGLEETILVKPWPKAWHVLWAWHMFTVIKYMVSTYYGVKKYQKFLWRLDFFGLQGWGWVICFFIYNFFSLQCPIIIICPFHLPLTLFSPVKTLTITDLLCVSRRLIPLDCITQDL